MKAIVDQDVAVVCATTDCVAAIWVVWGVDPKFVCALDLSNEARRGVSRAEARDGGGSTLRLCEGREMPPRIGMRFCNLSDRRCAGGVAMVATMSGDDAKVC